MIAPLSFVFRAIAFTLLFHISFINMDAQCESSCENSDQVTFDFLLELYCNTDGDNWTNNDGWSQAINNGSDCDYCQWYGITCYNNHLTEIDLSENNMSGILPASLTKLEYLNLLNLSDNALEGQFPSPIITNGGLSSLIISNNQFEGPIPIITTHDYYEAEPQNIFIENNKFTGNIPSYMITDGWRNIDASNNELDGIFEEHVFMNLDSEGVYDFSNNMLTGSLPIGFNELFPEGKMKLQNNNFTGCFPEELFGLCEYNVLNTTENPELPWFGQFMQYCAENGFLENQYGAPCSDGNDKNGIDDVIKEDCTCGAKITSTKESKDQLNIHPNPCTKTLYIDQSHGQNLSISIYNTIGQKVEDIHNKTNSIDISHLQNGIYFLSVTNLSTRERSSYKIIKV